jgi:hypothetical protein
MMFERLKRFFLGGEPTPRLIDTVRLTIPEWHEDPPSGAMRTWHHPDGGVLTLAVVGGSAIPLTDVTALRSSCRRVAESGGGGLIETAVVDSPFGPSVRFIYKRLNRNAFTYTGMLLMPAGDQRLVLTTVDAERGTTGVREAIITAELFEAGELTTEQYEQSWAQDPYDPTYHGVDRQVLRTVSDDERYDEQFPDHPLSRVRRILSELPHNVVR